MAYSRYRYYEGSPVGGGRADPRPGYEQLPILTQTNFNASGGDMSDIVGSFDDNPLKAWAWNELGCKVSGAASTAYRCSGWYWRYWVAHIGASNTYNLSGIPDENSVLSAALAATNPSKPVVDLPVFLAELKDIPSMMLEAGRKKLRQGRPKAGNSTAEYNFGWEPLIRDLRKLIDIQASIDSRLKSLGQLKSGGYSRLGKVEQRDMTLDEGEIYPFAGYMGHVRIQPTRHTRIRRWASIRWVLNDDSPVNSASDDEMANLAQRAVLGRNASWESVWNAMPWSWLVDYFTNIGELLGASRNFLGCSPISRCVMTHAHSSASFKITHNAEGASVALGAPWTTTKWRTPMGWAYPTMRLPVLTVRQLSTLSSIALNRSNW